jgi:hypothetical protein
MRVAFVPRSAEIKPESMLESGDMLLALIVYMSNYMPVFGRVQDHNMVNGTASSNDGRGFGHAGVAM